MKYKAAFLFTLLIGSLFFVNSAFAQCFHPSYSSYVSRTVTSANSNPDPTLAGAAYTLYQTMQVTGTTTFGAGCDIMEFSAHHQPQIKNMIGAVGGTNYGPSVTAGSYISYSTTVSSSEWPYTEDISDTDAGIQCSVAGHFWDSGDSYLALEIAYTKSINSGIVKSTNCKYNDGTPCTVWYINSYCTPSTTPPDYNPSDFTAPSYLSVDSVRYIYELGVCARVNFSGVPWICIPAGPYPALGLPGTSTRASCTHNP